MERYPHWFCLLPHSNRGWLQRKSYLPFIGIKAVAERKLIQLAAAVTLEFLKSRPGNYLEALVGDRKGRHSIRINKQWRVCFVWTQDGPKDVEIVDCHG